MAEHSFMMPDELQRSVSKHLDLSRWQQEKLSEWIQAHVQQLEAKSDVYDFALIDSNYDGEFMESVHQTIFHTIAYKMFDFTKMKCIGKDSIRQTTRYQVVVPIIIKKDSNG